MSNLVLRSFYISPKLDERLRAQAFDGRTSKNELIRRYLEAGMQALDASGKQVAAKRAPGSAAMATRKTAAKKAPVRQAAAKRAPAKKAAPRKAG